MNVALKRDPVWLGSLPSPPASPTLLLLGGDGQQVGVPAPLLLAVSPLLRSILIDLIPPAYGPCFLSLPDVSSKVLHVVVDILDTGEVVGELENEIEEVRQVFRILGIEASLVSYHTDSIKVDQVLDRGIKEENVSEENTFEVKEEKIEDAEREDFPMKSKIVSHSELVSVRQKARPFYGGSIADAGSGKEKVDIYKKFSNRYFTGDEFSSSESESEKEELTSNETIGENQKGSSVPNQVKFPCHLCSLKFKFKYSLKRHIKAIHEQFRIPCHLCPSKFTTRQSFVMHIKYVHEQIKLHCDLCPLKFTTKQSLVRHIKNVHEHIKFPCDLCPLKFTTKQSLLRHIKSAHDLRIFCRLSP